MINPEYFNELNLEETQSPNGVTARYFNPRTPDFARVTEDYTVKEGETYYSLARRIFGADDQEFAWTVIADVNETFYPDELVAGHKIQLPVQVVRTNGNVS